MHFIQKSIKDWIVKSLQKSILLRDFSDFIEVFDFSDGFTYLIIIASYVYP